MKKYLWTFLSIGLLAVFGLVSGDLSALTGENRPLKPAGIIKTVSGKPKNVLSNFGKTIKRQWDFQNITRKELTTAWKPLAGQWRVGIEPGHADNRVLNQTDNRRRSRLFLSRDQYTNFEFAVRLRVDTSRDQTRNWQVGLIFRRVDAGCYYKLRVTSANIALSRLSPGCPAPIPGSESGTKTVSATGKHAKADEQMLMMLPLEVSPEKWYVLKVTCLGEQITIKFDGKEIQTLNDFGIGYGKLGIFTYKCRAFFDDLQLTYLPVPKMSKGIRPHREIFRPSRGRKILVYYRNPKTGPATVRVMDTRGELFNVLTQGVHSAGINSVVWDGWGLSSRKPETGRYLLEFRGGGRVRAVYVCVKP
ncbi:hypothetical protein KAR10_03660 [bacterium]|nr:hypothetical protein [bacterium]